MMINISSEDMANHIINMTSARKTERSTIIGILDKYAEYIAQLVMSGRWLTEEQKLEWLRENEWSGL